MALEDERGGTQGGGEVDDTAATDAVAGDHGDALTAYDVDDAVVGAQLHGVGEVGRVQTRSTLQDGDACASGGEVVGGDRAAEAAADDEDVCGLRAHAGLPEGVVAGCRVASALP